MERIRHLLNWLQDRSRTFWLRLQARRETVRRHNEEVRAEANILRDNTFHAIGNFQQRYLIIYLSMLISTFWFFGHIAARTFYTGLGINYSKIASLDNGLIYIFENYAFYLLILILLAPIAIYFFLIVSSLTLISHQRIASIARGLEVKITALGPMAILTCGSLFFCLYLVINSANPTKFPPSTNKGHRIEINGKEECAIIRGKLGEYFVITINTGLTFPVIRSEMKDMRYCNYKKITPKESDATDKPK